MSYAKTFDEALDAISSLTIQTADEGKWAVFLTMAKMSCLHADKEIASVQDCTARSLRDMAGERTTAQEALRAQDAELAALRAELEEAWSAMREASAKLDGHLSIPSRALSPKGKEGGA